MFLKFILIFFTELFILEAHLSPLELPPYNNERCTALNNGTHKHQYEFVPASTVVGFLFVGIWLGLIIIAKIMGNSSDKYKMNNEFDLVIFKPATSNKQDLLIGPRRIYSNNIYCHNINAAKAANIDFSLSLMNPRTSYTDYIHSISAENTSGTPIVTNNNSSLRKL